MIEKTKTSLVEDTKSSDAPAKAPFNLADTTTVPAPEKQPASSVALASVAKQAVIHGQTQEALTKEKEDEAEQLNKLKSFQPSDIEVGRSEHEQHERLQNANLETHRTYEKGLREIFSPSRNKPRGKHYTRFDRQEQKITPIPNAQVTPSNTGDKPTL